MNEATTVALTWTGILLYSGILFFLLLFFTGAGQDCGP